MAVNWSRVKRRLAAIESEVRNRISYRIAARETEDGCILLRAALRKAGLDPEVNAVLRRYDRRPNRSEENPGSSDASDRRAADAAFAAEDPVLSRRPSLVERVRQRAAAISPTAPAPLRDTFYDAVAWAIVRLGIRGAPLPASP